MRHFRLLQTPKAFTSPIRTPVMGLSLSDTSIASFHAESLFTVLHAPSSLGDSTKWAASDERERAVCFPLRCKDCSESHCGYPDWSSAETLLAPCLGPSRGIPTSQSVR